MSGSQGFLPNPNADNNKGSIYYSAYGATGSSNYYKTLSKSALKVSPFDTQVAGAAFPCAEEKYQSGNYINYYAKSGYYNITFQNNYGVNQLYLSGGYGHAKRDLNVGVSIGFNEQGISGGGISASLSKTYYDILSQSVSSLIIF